MHVQHIQFIVRLGCHIWHDTVLKWTHHGARNSSPTFPLHPNLPCFIVESWSVDTVFLSMPHIMGIGLWVHVKAVIWEQKKFQVQYFFEVLSQSVDCSHTLLLSVCPTNKLQGLILGDCRGHTPWLMQHFLRMSSGAFIELFALCAIALYCIKCCMVSLHQSVDWRRVT